MWVGAFDRTRNLQAVDAGEIDLHQHQVWVGIIDELDSLLAIAGLARNSEVGQIRQIMAQPLTKERVGVDEHNRGWAQVALLITVRVIVGAIAMALIA
jgi:hypothetical protein